MVIASIMLAMAAPRATIVAVPTGQSLADLQACASRAMIRHGGSVTPIPLADGMALDYTTAGFLSFPTGPSFTFEIHDSAGLRRLGAAYRHPLTYKVAVITFRDIAKICFPEDYASAYPGDSWKVWQSAQSGGEDAAP